MLRHIYVQPGRKSPCLTNRNISGTFESGSNTLLLLSKTLELNHTICAPLKPCIGVPVVQALEEGFAGPNVTEIILMMPPTPTMGARLKTLKFKSAVHNTFGVTK